MEEKQPKPFCMLCAGSFRKGYEHTMDRHSCLLGRRKWYKTLTPEEQISEIRKYELLSSDMVDFVWNLSQEKNISPCQIMDEESLWLF